MESSFLIDWLIAAGEAVWLRSICYAIISPLAFVAGFLHPRYRWLWWGASFHFGAALFYVFGLSIDRPDIAERQRGFITISAVYLAVFTSKHFLGELRHVALCMFRRWWDRLLFIGGNDAD